LSFALGGAIAAAAGWPSPLMSPAQAFGLGSSFTSLRRPPDIRGSSTAGGMPVFGGVQGVVRGGRSVGLIEGPIRGVLPVTSLARVEGVMVAMLGGAPRAWAVEQPHRPAARRSEVAGK